MKVGNLPGGGGGVEGAFVGGGGGGGVEGAREVRLIFFIFPSKCILIMNLQDVPLPVSTAAPRVFRSVGIPLAKRPPNCGAVGALLFVIGGAEAV